MFMYDQDDFKIRSDSSWGLLSEYIEIVFQKFRFIQIIMQKKRVQKQLLSIRSTIDEMLQNNSEQLLIQLDQKFKKLGF